MKGLTEAEARALLEAQLRTMARSINAGYFLPPDRNDTKTALKRLAEIADALPVRKA